MKTVPLLLALACSAACGTGRAQTVEAAPVSLVEVSGERQQLSNGGPDWTETSLRLNRTHARQEVAEITLTQARRFGLADDQIAGLYSQALDPRWGATVEASVSGTHQFLPQHSLGGALQYEFAPAWLVHGGLKASHYTDAAVGQGLLMLEHYVGNYSGAVAWRPVQTRGREAASAELRASRYYGEHSVATLSLTGGQEAAQISSGAIELVDVHAVALFGRHLLSPRWALSYALSATRYGDFYTRNGLRAGVQYLF